MKRKDKFYLLIEEVEASLFSVWGNDVTWSGKVVDENDAVVNEHFSVKTREYGVDLFTEVNERDEECKIINEEGDIIDQEAYDEDVEAVKEMYTEYYWEMDEDVAESREIEGKWYVKVAIEDFVERHGFDDSRWMEGRKFDCNSVEGLIVLEKCCGGLSFDDEWSEEFIYLDEFEWNESYSDYIEGWLRTTDGGEEYISLFGVAADEESRRKLEELENGEQLYDALKDAIYDMVDEHISVREFRRRTSAEYVDMTKVVGVATGFNAAYLNVKL